MDYNWDCKYQPSFTISDKFGLSWTDGFIVVPGTPVYSYRAIAHTNFSTFSSSTGAQQTYTDWTPGTGIGWTVNLVGMISGNGILYVPDEHKGWGEVKISKISQKNGSGVNNSVVGSYFHQQTTFSGSLSFSPSPSLSISNSFAYDKAPDSGNSWYWVNNWFLKGVNIFHSH